MGSTNPPGALFFRHPQISDNAQAGHHPSAQSRMARTTRGSRMAYLFVTALVVALVFFYGILAINIYRTTRNGSGYDPTRTGL
jgi:hypothetical protein